MAAYKHIPKLDLKPTIKELVLGIRHMTFHYEADFVTFKNHIDLSVLPYADSLDFTTAMEM